MYSLIIVSNRNKRELKQTEIDKLKKEKKATSALDAQTNNQTNQ